MKANEYVKDISNADFAYFNINCRLKVRFKNRREKFFDSMEDVISKIDSWKASIGNCEWLPFVFVCRSLNTAKYVACFYNC